MAPAVSGLKRFWIDAASAVMSGALLVLSFPPFDMPFLAWIALIPLLLLIRNSGLIKALLFSIFAGSVFFGGLLWWVLRITIVNPFNFGLGIFIAALFIGLFGISAYFLQRRMPGWSTMVVPTTWVLIEYLRTHIGFLSFPWGILGYTQYSVLSVASISAFCGIYGVSFFIVSANTVLTEGIYLYCHSREEDFKLSHFISRRKVSVGILAVVPILLLISFLTFSFAQPYKTQTRSLKVALIQGNIYYDESDKLELSEKVIGKYSALTMKALNPRPDLIIWPSSSIAGRLPFDGMLVRILSDLARRTETFMLLGSSGFDKFNAEQRKLRRIANSAFLFSPQGKILGRYDKIRLLPFDEYVPLRGLIKWPEWVVSSKVTDHLPGKEMTIFNVNRYRFSVLICWENYFPDLFRKMVEQGVDFMVSQTNEAFIDAPAAHYQMLSMNVFRAIENHISIARISSTGVSSIVGPDGRIIARVKDSNSNDVNIEGYLVSQIPLSSSRSFYNRHGDWFISLLVIMLFGLILWKEVINKYFVRKTGNDIVRIRY
jgi:apolipoprotein N-acyltransferase